MAYKSIWRYDDAFKLVFQEILNKQQQQIRIQFDNTIHVWFEFSLSYVRF